jgi:hypothetical protein
VQKLSFHQEILFVRHAKRYGRIICLLVKQLVPIEADEEYQTDNEIQDPNLENLVVLLKLHLEARDLDRLP